MLQRLVSPSLPHSLRCTAASATAIAVLSALATQQRTYFWPYNEDFVPKGATTSRFQSSSVPSVRERVIREYAYSPLFGAREPCCVLGFRAGAREVMGRKPALRAVLASVLGVSAAQVALGETQQMKEMMLYRGGTSESPRLQDAVGGHPAAEYYRRCSYARMPVVASTLVEVFLSDEVPEEDQVASGMYIQEQLTMQMAASSAAVSMGSSHAQEEIEDEEAEDESGAGLFSDLLSMGVVYCEVPAIDESGFVFDRLHGKPMDADAVERVVERWNRRLTKIKEEEKSTV